MRKLSLLLTALAVVLVMGCSVMQPHEDVQSVASAARVSGSIDVVTSQRWVLPTMSAISVREAGSAHAAHIDAARQGLSAHFRMDEGAPWHLIVHWPEHAEPASTSSSSLLRIDLLPWEEMIPAPAERDQLIVDVMDASGLVWVQRVHVDVKPWWFGRDWHERGALVDAFDAVGRALTGS